MYTRVVSFSDHFFLKMSRWLVIVVLLKYCDDLHSHILIKGENRIVVTCDSSCSPLLFIFLETRRENVMNAIQLCVASDEYTSRIGQCSLDVHSCDSPLCIVPLGLPFASFLFSDHSLPPNPFGILCLMRRISNSVTGKVELLLRDTMMWFS